MKRLVLVAVTAALLVPLAGCRDDCADGMRTAPGDACPRTTTTPTDTAGGQR